MHLPFLRSTLAAAVAGTLAALAVGCATPLANDAPIIDSVEAPLEVREQDGKYSIPVAILFHDNDTEAVTHVRYRLPPNIDGMMDVPAANPTKESARLTIVISAADLDDDAKGGPVPGLTSSTEKKASDAKRETNGAGRGGRGRRTLELSILDGRGAESRPQISVINLD